ncbi:SpoVT-AbrB domain-containing protein, partial [Dysosmobacter welbionis]
AHRGAPQVTPFSRPERNTGASASLRAVERWLFPGFRRARKAFSSSRSMASPAGRPSTTTPMALPWDWPKTEIFRRLPNSEDMDITSQVLVHLPEIRVGLLHALGPQHRDGAGTGSGSDGGRHGDPVVVGAVHHAAGERPAVDCQKVRP